jgi:hypothetical protein
MPRIMTATRDINHDEKRPKYVGRDTSAAPATGMAKVSLRHLLAYLEVFKLPPSRNSLVVSYTYTH